MLADCCAVANEPVVLAGLLEWMQFDAGVPKQLLDLTYTLEIGVHQTEWVCWLLGRVEGCLV